MRAPSAFNVAAPAQDNLLTGGNLNTWPSAFRGKLHSSTDLFLFVPLLSSLF
jgi:hypothetical protein